MTGPPDSVPAWLYDGRSAVRRTVTIAHESAGLRIVETGEHVSADLLEPRGDLRRTVFGRRDVPGWRLGFDAPPPADWRALPRQEHHGGLLDSWGPAKALIVCGMLGILVLLGLWKGAAVAAQFVPERWEVALGDTLAGDMGGAACSGAEGQGALDRLAARLTPDGRPVTVNAVDLDMINAVTLPGRRVLVFNGLIQEARSPDELAGVLAHEIGHVAHRDAMAGLIRGFGLSLVVGGADGGAMAQSLITNRYSRSVERNADDFAVSRLAAANVSPRATAALFDRLGAMERAMGVAGVAMGYLSSHPLSVDRNRLFAAATRPGHAYRPALDAREWRAVRAMCAKPAKKR